MTAMQIFCYSALLIAVAGVAWPYRPFQDRQAAALTALAAFVALGLSTPFGSLRKTFPISSGKSRSRSARKQNRTSGLAA